MTKFQVSLRVVANVEADDIASARTVMVQEANQLVTRLEEKRLDVFDFEVSAHRMGKNSK